MNKNALTECSYSCHFIYMCVLVVCLDLFIGYTSKFNNGDHRNINNTRQIISDRISHFTFCEKCLTRSSTSSCFSFSHTFYLCCLLFFMFTSFSTSSIESKTKKKIIPKQPNNIINFILFETLNMERFYFEI